MNEKFIAYAIIGIVVAILMGFLNKASKAKPATNIHGNAVLKLPMLYGIIGIISVIIGLIVIAFGLINFKQENILPQTFLFIMFGGLGGLLVLQAINTRIILADKEIIKISMFGNKTILPWPAIKKVSFNSISLELKIQSETTRIKCHQHLVGFPLLIESLEKKSGLTRDEMKIPRF